MAETNIQITPYISFHGNCEEALNFYKTIFDGSSFQVVQRYDAPQMQAPEHYKNKVLHAMFNFGTDMFFAADMFPGAQSPAGSNISLSFDTADPQHGKRMFDQLSEGGSIGIAFEKQFWGDWHGNLVDKYGVR